MSSAIAGADGCLRYGRAFIKACQTFQEADEHIKADVLLLEAIWNRTAGQVEFVKRIADSLEDEHARVHIELFEMLRSKLTMAMTKMEWVQKGNSEKTVQRGLIKGRYVLVRENIEQVISDLERWQRIFDPTWFLILRMSDSLVDSELSNDQTAVQSISSDPSIKADSSSTLSTAQKLRSVLHDNPNNTGKDVHVSLPEDGLDWSSAVPISFSDTLMVRRVGSEKLFAVDTIICDSNVDRSRARSDAEALAKKLKQIEPSVFSLLSCHGVVRRKDPETNNLSSIGIIFRVPSPDEYPEKPLSLRGLFINESKPSLTQILDIARQLTRAVSFVHTCNFVHKNIRPENILIFSPKNPVSNSSAPFVSLLGFNSFRNINFQTALRGDTAWDRNLYRHPQRQGQRVHDSFVMQHDVYSLGVCLLELGLWQTFVQYQQIGARVASSCETTAGSILDFPIEHFDFNGKEASEQSALVKDNLVELARALLPMRMGDKYTAVVVTCLICLDEDNEDFGKQEDMLDEDGVLVGVKFIEKVLCRLDEISL